MSKWPAPERWREIDELFDRALDIAPEQWPAFLDESCPDDEVRRAVSQLLTANSDSGSFLGRGAEAAALEALVEALRYR